MGYKSLWQLPVLEIAGVGLFLNVLQQDWLQ